jgi:alpha-amylase/alpha-mannosidase (GH57 family)
VTEHLSVCFVWHMHQPLYKDRMSGIYLMPWVRLHAIKDYLDMPLLLKNYPKIRQTFNLVPSLIEQLEDYAWHKATDKQMQLTCKNEHEYTFEDKVYLLSESFHANLDRQIRSIPQFFGLFMKRQRLLKKDLTYSTMVDEFSAQELADMSALFNLVWFDPIWFSNIPELQQLKDQGSNFTLAQRRRIIEIEIEVIQKTVSVYKELQDAGNIEVTTSPYYHPILPLLIDTNVARLPNPYTTLPQQLYFHKEDAEHQLSAGLALYQEKLGCPARGMWPSEMSVSPAALQMIAQQGIKWVVLDEALLTKTLEQGLHRDEHGNLNSAEMLCQPYKLQVGDESINILFREVVLSNEISFSYAGRHPADAATSLYMRLKHIQQRLFNWHREGAVVIALDGENCWETYEQDGNLFLNELYRRLSEDNTLNVCTVSDYLERNPPTVELFNIHSGSWIGADYHIWIGDPLKNKAWDLLATTRRFLVAQLEQKEYAKETQAKAWEEIYAAEGSDWFWWFGEPNSSEHDEMFDQQFRLRLQNVYKLLGCEYPEHLDSAVHDLVHKQAEQSQALPEILVV